MQSPNRNKVVLISILLFPVVISLVVFNFISSRNSDSNAEEYLDPGSGETVSTPKNKTPELFGVETQGPLFLGFSRLIDSGLTTGQLDLVKAAFARFSTTESRNITELSVTVDTIDQKVEDGSVTMTFDLTANRQTKYLCSISYANFNEARLVVTDASGKQVFDSSVQ